MLSDQGFIRHCVACNKHDLGGFVPFFMGDTRFGRIKKDLASFLLAHTDFFVSERNGLVLSPRFSDFGTRSDALLQASEALAAHIHEPLRHEFYPVVQAWNDAPIAQLDRAAVVWFGVRAWGVHTNGFVRKPEGLFLWIGERAQNRQIAPGKLDNLFGGGQPIRLSREENLCKEAYEEAGIEPALAKTAQYIHTISYMREQEYGLRTDSLFVYDLELADGFVPRNTDGEVGAFHLMSLSDVAETVGNTDRFKFNCALVLTDFLIRHGFFGSNSSLQNAMTSFLTA
ncbi:MAG: DUF4743 domain-containing protein [Alphaproteobacteria bacterium]|nr:DUF4743 domain-containing protein [Alphaproteobacteria bacterium]